jgi:peptide/nickel transport system permease protein
MLRFVLRRLLLMVPTLLIVSLFVFMLQKLMPGDIAVALAGEERNMDVVAFLRAKYHLDDPLTLQYWYWLKAVLSGDLGQSIKMEVGVGPLLVAKLVVTLQLSALAMLIAIAIGVPLGIAAAIKHGTGWDLASNVGALTTLSVPNFWLGILLILVFSIWLGWLPASGYVPFWEHPLDSLRSMIMPAFVLGASIAGMLMRHVRSAMLEVLGADYVRTARAKGVPERRVILVHALRNALVPVITFLSVVFGELLAGAVLTEQIFNVPGIGKLVVDSVFSRDYTVVQGVVMCSAIIFLLMNLFADVANALVNPRSRL